MNYPNSVQKLIELFSKFPTVGTRTSSRFVLYLLGRSEEERKELSKEILNLKKNVKTCPLCFNFFEHEAEKEYCNICIDSRRDKSKLCLIEKNADLLAIENINKYNGLYFILGGTISSLKKDYFKNRIRELKKRITNDSSIKEIIIATNSTTQGEATALYLKRLLESSNKKIVKLARGLPVGGELEYADEETISSAFEQRK